MAKAKTKKKKKTVARRRTAKTSVPGSQYACDQCGMVVQVVDPCGCEDPCDLICCGQQMSCR